MKYYGANLDIKILAATALTVPPTKPSDVINI